MITTKARTPIWTFNRTPFQSGALLTSGDETILDILSTNFAGIFLFFFMKFGCFVAFLMVFLVKQESVNDDKQ